MLHSFYVYRTECSGAKSPAAFEKIEKLDYLFLKPKVKVTRNHWNFAFWYFRHIGNEWSNLIRRL